MNKNGKSLKRYGFYDFPFLSYNLKYTRACLKKGGDCAKATK